MHHLLLLLTNYICTTVPATLCGGLSLYLLILFSSDNSLKWYQSLVWPSGMRFEFWKPLFGDFFCCAKAAFDSWLMDRFACNGFCQRYVWYTFWAQFLLAWTDGFYILSRPLSFGIFHQSVYVCRVKWFVFSWGVCVMLTRHGCYGKRVKLLSFFGQIAKSPPGVWLSCKQIP